MPRAIAAQTGWPGGEWSPRLLGRFDLEQYNRALQVCENAIPLPQGAVIRRPPTRFLADIPDDPATRIIPFIPSNSAATVIVVQPGVFRVFDPVTGALVSGPSPHTISTADLETISWAQDVDVVYIARKSGFPAKITRLSPINYVFSNVVFLDGRAPLAPVNFNSTNVATLTGTWPNLVVTMTAATFIAADVGRAFFARDFINKRAVYCTITAVSSPTNATLLGLFQQGGPALPDPGPDWALGLFSDTRGCNAVCFHEARLWYGGFAEEPDLAVGSVSNSFDNFETVSPDPTVSAAGNADRSIARRFDGAPILWMASSPSGLVVGAARQESILVPGVTGILTPTEASARAITERGSEDGTSAVRIDSSLFFIERGGRRIRQAKFTDSDSFDTLDATVLTQQFTITRLRRLAYQQVPYSVLWALDRSGRLFGWTIEGEQQVLGGHRHTLGGADYGRHPNILDIGCVPVSRGGSFYDALVLAVRRVINNQYFVTLETMEPVSITEPHVEDETPREKMVADVERVPYIDSYRRAPGNVEYIITNAVCLGPTTPIVFTYSANSPHPAAGEEIVFRGLEWQDGNVRLDSAAVNREIYTVQNVNTAARTFEIRALSATTNAVPGDVGLPVTTSLYVNPDKQPPYASRRVSNLPPFPGPPGDALTYVADAMFKDSVPPDEPASLVFFGYRYKTRIKTMPWKLSQGLVPTDAGEPAIITRVALRLRSAIGGAVSVGGTGASETLVMGTTDDLMDGPPVPAYRDFVLPVNGSWVDDTSLLIETDTFFPFELLGIYANMKTNLR